MTSASEWIGNSLPFNISRWLSAATMEKFNSSWISTSFTVPQRTWLCIFAFNPYRKKAMIVKKRDEKNRLMKLASLLQQKNLQTRLFKIEISERNERKGSLATSQSREALKRPADFLFLGDSRWIIARRLERGANKWKWISISTLDLSPSLACWFNEIFIIWLRRRRLIICRKSLWTIFSLPH